MRQHTLHILLALLACGSWFFISCEPETTCHQKLGTVAQITLFADSITSSGDTIHYTQWDSITIVGVGNDIGLKRTKTKSLELELHPNANLTKFLLLYHNQIDTLYIQHTPKQHFVNLACGCAVYHTITAAWSSDPRVDSVSIINANVETLAQENLRIYLHE